jgi:hypothetical protein
VTTEYQTKFYVHELSRRHSVADAGTLEAAHLNARPNLNHRQVEAAFKSLPSRAAIADELQK